MITSTDNKNIESTAKALDAVRIMNLREYSHLFDSKFYRNIILHHVHDKIKNSKREQSQFEKKDPSGTTGTVGTAEQNT